jgi:hypothetical protein
MGNEYQNYLKHYGVQGMKWGVRRTPEELGHIPKAGTPDQNNKEKENRLREANHVWLKNDATDDEIREKALPLYREIRDKYYDWYNGKPKSESVKKVVGNKRGEDTESSSFRKKVAKAVLKDMGMNPNNDNIEMILPLIFDD